MDLSTDLQRLIQEGQDHLAAGRPAEAERSSDAALALDPHSAEALQLKITALRKQLRFDDALRLAESAVKDVPKSPLLENEKALVHADRDELDLAVAGFRRSLELDPNGPFALRSAIHYLRRLERWDEALVVAEKALASRPTDVDILAEVGLLHYFRDAHAEAVGLFDRALAIDPKDAKALEWKVTALRRSKRFDEAEKAMAQALRHHPHSVRMHNEEGYLRYDQRRFGEAAAAFDRALGIDPGNEDAHRLKAVCLRRARRFEEAHAALEVALAALPGSIALRSELANLYWDQERNEDALAVFEGILDEAPSNEDAWVGKITCLRLLRRADEAERAIEAAREALPGSAKVINERGLLYADRREYDRAAEQFEAALALDPDDTFARDWRTVARVRFLRKKQRFDEAVAELEAARAGNPDSSTLASEEGWLRYDREEYDEAVTCFERAIELNPGWTELRSNLADMLVRGNRVQEAREVFDRSLAETPDDLELRHHFGWFLVGTNEYPEAQEQFELVREREPENLHGLNGLGAVAFYQDRYEDAEGWFRKALAVDVSNPQLHVNIARAIVRRGDEERFGEAAELCRRGLALDPDNADGHSCLGVIAYRQGRILDAENHLLKSVRADSKEGGYVDLGALYAKMGRFDEAATNLEKAVRLKPRDVRAHVELGNLHLQQDRSGPAIQEFRNAMALAPESAYPPDGLAIALMRKGDFGEAEQVLRDAIRRLDWTKRWRLHLTLSRLLTRLGDKTKEKQYYEEALQEVSEAMVLKPHDPDPYFHSGIVRAKLEDYRNALHDFRACLELDKTHFEAERNARRLEVVQRQARFRSGGSLVGGIVVGTVAIVQLVALWYFYFTTEDKISEAMLTVMVPILLGLVVVAFLLPWLIKLKLPGLEAELSQPTEALSTGPVGGIGFSASAPSISQGLR